MGGSEEEVVEDEPAYDGPYADLSSDDLKRSAMRQGVQFKEIRHKTQKELREILQAAEEKAKASVELGEEAEAARQARILAEASATATAETVATAFNQVRAEHEEEEKAKKEQEDKDKA